MATLAHHHPGRDGVGRCLTRLVNYYPPMGRGPPDRHVTGRLSSCKLYFNLTY